MVNKVVFFVLGMSPRMDRRIREFVKNGFDVEVYGGRDESSKRYESEDGYKYNVLYEIGDKFTYKERMKKLPLFKNVVKKYNKKTTIFYLFSLNVAVLALYTPGLKFIYEESDMLFDRLSNPLLRKLVVKINKHIINKSFLTVFTSEGFADYYYGANPPSNIVVIPNRVGPTIKDVEKKEKLPIDFNRLRFGFVGFARYNAIINVSDTVVEKFSDGEFHYYGDLVGLKDKTIEHLKTQANVFLHGAFDYPKGLAEAYSHIDFTVCTYDISGINTRYAEPNKLYEAIYFETPIIVSSNTFLAKKVERLGIGLSVDSNDKEDIYRRLKDITPQQYQSYVNAMKSISKDKLINVNDAFFKILKENIENDSKKVKISNMLLDS